MCIRDRDIIVFRLWQSRNIRIMEVSAIMFPVSLRLLPVSVLQMCIRDSYTTDRDEIEEIAKREVRDKYKPELASLPQNIEQYDVCLLYTSIPTESAA